MWKQSLILLLFSAIEAQYYEGPPRQQHVVQMAQSPQQLMQQRAPQMAQSPQQPMQPQQIFQAPPQPQQTIQIPTVYYSKPCPDCKAPSVTVVTVPATNPTSTALEQMLSQQLLLSSLASPLSPMLLGGLGGLGGQQGLSQPLQLMAMMHLMQGQGMNYYQQMQMLAMYQMARRMGGRPVPVQPIIRTTAEYRYPGKKVLFWPPYISTQYKAPKRRPMMRKMRPEGATRAPIIVSEARTATPPMVTRLYTQQQAAYNRRS